MNRNCSDDAIGLRIDDRNCARLSVDDVDFIAEPVCDQIGRISTDLQRPILTQVDKIKHRNGIGASVADIGELAIAVGNVRKAATVAARDAKQKRADGYSRWPERESEGEKHCLESIEEDGGAASESLGSREFRVLAKLFAKFSCL